ncbi:MAG: MBL fold metallo-hydrolase [Thermomicrobiales bacterium]
MKLTVLGGAAAGGNPGQGCSGYLVQTGRSSAVLDLGPGTLPQLRLHADAAALDGIVISHMHIDHILDLLALRYFLAYVPGRTERRVPLHLPPGGAAFLERFAVALAEDGDGLPWFDRFDIMEYDPNSPLMMGDLRMTFTPTILWVPCWAMRVTIGHSYLVYTADTGPSANLADFARGASLIVTEGAADDHGETPFASRLHQTPEEAGNLATDAGVETLVLTHLWAEYGVDRAATRAATRFDGRILIARPGLSVDL